MLTQLHGKDVVVYLGIIEWLSEPVKGKVVATNDQWIQVKSKKGLEFILLASIKKIVLSG